MATPALSIASLLDPIPGENPAGEDLEGAPEWYAILEARRADDPLSRGKWERAVKVADWKKVLALSSEALASRTKDLRIGVWLLEASVHLRSFPGLADGFQLLKDLLTGFHDKGLYPKPALRGPALRWIGHGDKLPLVIRLLPLTAGPGYGVAAWDQSLKIGSEKDASDQYGNVDEAKKNRYDAAIRSGGVSKEMMRAAIQATPKPFFQALYQDVTASRDALMEMTKAVDAVFSLDPELAEETPSFSETREVLDACLDAIDRMNDGFFSRGPAKQTEAPETPSAAMSVGPTLPPLPTSGDVALVGSWQAAFDVVHQGNVDQGLAQMAALAAAESGRASFMRRLQLAEICMQRHRQRLALSILEDLAAQVDALNLHKWESPQLIGRVWGQLGKAYEGGENSEKARALFDRLRVLDPWQALIWDQRS